MARNLMIQGTMSNAGKSIITAGLLRVLHQDGYACAPFKSQNMALNSFITREGLEMGRAQVMQAEAAGTEPDIRMNPLLLKPNSDMGSQLIINGEVYGNYEAAQFFAMKKDLLPIVLQAYGELAREYEVIIIEGAGSPAEINLKAHDIVNMGLAAAVDAPVLLVGDIDRGGVFAQLLGTIWLLEKEERKRIKGLVINKFRGDRTILEPGLEQLYRKCHIPITGVIPYAKMDIDEEDSLTERFDHPLCMQPDEEKIIAAVILLPHISNYTDFSLLAAYEGVSLSYIKNVRELGRPDLVILPGSKNTMGDLLWLRQSGLEASIQRLAKEGKRIIGICGGYQMLGKTIRDPDCMEHGGLLRGIGLLPAATCFGNKKHRTRVTGKIEKQETCYQTLSHVEFEGYEIHMGDTVLEEGATARSFAVLKDSVNNTCYNDGYVKDNILGTYVHGILDSPQLLKALLTPLFEEKGLQMEAVEYEDHYRYKLRQYDLLADVIREHMDMKAVYEMLGL